MAKQKSAKEEPIEKQLWKAANKLRKNIDAAEYKYAVLGLNRNHAHSIELAIPSIRLIHGFNNTAEPFFDNINRNNTLLNKLEKLRDKLLPKIMSGVVEVAQ